MNYELVTHDELQGLRSTLSLLERVLENDPLELFFYGISQNTGLLAKANEALEEAYEVDEQGESSPKVTQIAVVIPLTSDSAHYLVGSGLILRKEAFAYVAGQDGVRTSDLAYSARPARVTDEDFSEMAVSKSDSWIDDFLVKHTANKPPAAPQAVKRTESATSEDAEEPPNAIDEFLK